MAKSSVKRSDKKEGKKTGLHSMNPDRNTAGLKGVAKPRSAGTIKRLQMYRNFKAKRDKRGVVIKAAPYQGYVDSGTRARYRVTYNCHLKDIQKFSLKSGASKGMV